MHTVPNTGPSPAPPGPLRKGDGRTGFVVVRLRPDVPQTDATDLATHAEQVGLPGLVQLLEALGRPPTTRLVVSVAPGILREAEADARRSPWPPLHSLTAYWRIDARQVPGSLDDVVERLAGVPGVDLAYLDIAVGDPAVNASDDPFSIDQGYLRESPAGIDAQFAWTLPGGDGAGVGVLDVEQRWTMDHESLRFRPPELLSGDNRADLDGDGNHGSAVLAVVAAADDTLGVVGIAPNAGPVRVSSHFHRSDDPAHRDPAWVADAITAAALAPKRPRPGDVLLVEVEILGEQTVPAESDPANRDAIRLASALGLVVVAAAGNGQTDLDAWHDAAGKFVLDPKHADFVDSGSILVGSAFPEVTKPPAGVAPPRPGHAISLESNFGRRVGCYGWGYGVATAGYGDLTPKAAPIATYTQKFAGTSAATPIIAGAAALLQSITEQTTGTRLSPEQMRTLLTSEATGTPQYTAPGRKLLHIGVLPDLRQIVTRLGLVPDAYLRDAIGDTGAVPSTGPIGESPDVICVLDPVADPVAAFGEFSGTADNLLLSTGPVPGRDATLYVRARNRGAAAAVEVRALIYSTPVMTVQTPADWTIVGMSGPFDVPSGDTLAVSPAIPWVAPADPDHGLVVVLDHPGDPRPTLPTQLTWDEFVAAVHDRNNITFRNVHVIDVPPVVDGGPPPPPSVLPFLLTGDPDQARRFDLRIATRLPADARLHLELPPAAAGVLPPDWRHRAGDARTDGRHRLPLPRTGATIQEIRLPAGVRHSVRLLLEPSADLDAGLHTVTLRQFSDGRQIGSVTWVLRPAARDLPATRGEPA